MISDGASQEETGRISSKGGIKEPGSSAPTVTFTVTVSGIKRPDYKNICIKSIRLQCLKFTKGGMKKLSMPALRQSLYSCVTIGCHQIHRERGGTSGAG